MINKLTLEQKINKRISKKKSNVLLREDFRDLGDYDQVGRVLRGVVQKGIIVKIGYGLYAKTRVSSITGEVVPITNLPSLGKEALGRLKIKMFPSRSELDYKEGRSTQVPTGRMIGVKGRISRKISYKGVSIAYEHVA